MQFHQGTLIALPVELRSTQQFEFYTRVCKLGWNTCPQGYQVYVGDDAVGNRYIVPGLTINGIKRSQKKFYERNIVFEQNEIVEFTASLIAESERVENLKNAELSLLIHDLRALSSAIYNSAEAARSAVETGKHDLAQDRVETVIATHTMLSIRIDMLDVATNQITTAASDRIPVYKKMDKVVRCFRPKASARNIAINLRATPAPSYAATYGPAILELVAYAVIDNAVKYSPDGRPVSVEVEDQNRDVIVRVKSFGPYIEPSERSKIFEKGYRGRQATKTGQPGTGIGLSTARELVENHFDGAITVHQDAEAQQLDGLSYFQTEFEIIVPRFEA